MFNVEEEIRNFLEAGMTTLMNKYYIGKVANERIPGNHLPVLMVWGTNTTLITDQISTARDKYTFTINIRIVVNAYKYVNAVTGVEADKILKLQQAVKQFFEERDANMKPLATTVLGLLRANVKGTDYLFSNNIEITYEEENVDGQQYFFGTLTLAATSRFNSR